MVTQAEGMIQFRTLIYNLPVCAIEQYGLNSVIEGIHPVEASGWDIQA